jgi:hypothetical protein
MKFLPNSADIPNDLIRSVSDGDVIFLCGAGVSLGVGLPTFKKLTDDVYARIGEDRSHEPAEAIAYDKEEYDRVLRSLEKRTLLHGTESRVRVAVSQILTAPASANLSHHKSLLQLSRDRAGRIRLITTNFDTLLNGRRRRRSFPSRATPVNQFRVRGARMILVSSIFMVVSRIPLSISRSLISSSLVLTSVTPILETVGRRGT